MSKENPYEVDIRIDESQLDVEWLEQPGLTFKYSKMVANLESAMNASKEALDLVRAELDVSIRKKPAEYGLEKVTEEALRNTILLQEDFQEAQQELQDATYEYKIARAALDAITVRKSALENLVRLHGSNYFAGPSIPHDLQEMASARRAKSNSTIKIKK